MRLAVSLLRSSAAKINEARLVFRSGAARAPPRLEISFRGEGGRDLTSLPIGISDVSFRLCFCEEVLARMRTKSLLCFGLEERRRKTR